MASQGSSEDVSIQSRFQDVTILIHTCRHIKGRHEIADPDNSAGLDWFHRIPSTLTKKSLLEPVAFPPKTPVKQKRVDKHSRRSSRDPTEPQSGLNSLIRGSDQTVTNQTPIPPALSEDERLFNEFMHSEPVIMDSESDFTGIGAEVKEPGYSVRDLGI